MRVPNHMTQAGTSLSDGRVEMLSRRCRQTPRERAHDPSAPQPVVHARIECAGAGKGPQPARRRHHPRPRGFRGAGRQGAWRATRSRRRSPAKGFGKREVLIRINALDSPWWVDDIAMAGKARPDGILVPKISSVADLNAIADRLSDINADTSIRVWAMIETARAVLHAEELAAASHDSENPARRLRVRAERYFARDADPDAARPRGDDPDDHALHPRYPRPRPRNPRRALQRFQQCRWFRPGMRARPRPRLRRQDADPSRPDRGLQRDLHAAGGGSRRGPQDHRRVRAAGERRVAARSRSTARWWSGCTPTWRGAPSRSPMRSRRWGTKFYSSGAPLLPFSHKGRREEHPSRLSSTPQTSPPPRHRGCRQPAAGCRGLSAKCGSR